MPIMSKDRPQSARIPGVALLLGWAGVIPFAALAAVVILASPAYAGAGLTALIGYGAVILSFMGGVLWGLEMSQGRSQVAYVVSIAPALLAVVAMGLQAKTGIFLLLCGFAALLIYDLKTSSSSGAPSWYPVLRLQLTAAVIALLSIALLVSKQP
jgi:hypothetical protein